MKIGILVSLRLFICSNVFLLLHAPLALGRKIDIERNRERDRQTDRQTDRDRDREDTILTLKKSDIGKKDNKQDRKKETE